MKSLITILLLLLLGQPVFAETYTLSAGWNEEPRYYPVTWTAHVNAPAAWQAEHAYQLGDIAGPTVNGTVGLQWECTRAGTSGATEPGWTTAINDIVEDPDTGGAQWTLRSNGVASFAAGTLYAQGAVVNGCAYGMRYTATVAGYGGSACPSITTEGETVSAWNPDIPVIIRLYANGTQVGAAYDTKVHTGSEQASFTFTAPAGAVEFTATAEHAAYPKWQPETPYIEGQSVVAPTIQGGGKVVYTCTTSGTSGASAPTWSIVNGATVADGTAVWTVQNSTVTPWEAATAYTEGMLVLPSSQVVPPGTAFRCTRAGTSGATEPNWNTVTKFPWWALWRRWVPAADTVEDPDTGGAQWTRIKISSSESTLSNRFPFALKTNSAGTRVGRSLR